MPKYTRTDVLAFLEDVKTAGVVYNSEFNDWKRWASNAIDAEIKACKKQTYLSSDYEQSRADTELYYNLICLSVMNFPSKKLEKSLVNMNTPFSSAISQIANEWQPISETFKQLKTEVVKGRKPLAEARHSPVRTLDNTGTCSCCQRNIKLSNGKMVDHGYNIRDGFRSGKCFGVGYEPWEISPKGLISLIASDEAVIDQLRTQMHNLAFATVLRVKKPGYSHFPKFEIVELTNANVIQFEQQRARQQEDMQRQIAFLTRSIKQNKKRVDQWRSTSLPKA